MFRKIRKKIRKRRIVRKVLPLLSDYRKIQIPGRAPLVVEKIGPDEYSLAQYCGAFAAPKMTIRICGKGKKIEVEVLEYRHDILGVCQRAPDPEEAEDVLKTWLNDLRLL